MTVDVDDSKFNLFYCDPVPSKKGMANGFFKVIYRTWNWKYSRLY